MSNFGDQNFIKIRSLTRSKSPARATQSGTILSYQCVLGKNGQTVFKREGDGKSPIGCWHPIGLYYRADRVQRPQTTLPITPLKPADGWCDEGDDRNYNRPVKHPYKTSAERLWRDDELYDIIVVLDHNQCPRVRNRGSAIFIHVAKEGYPPTEGCIALKKADLIKLVPGLTRRTRIII